MDREENMSTLKTCKKFVDGVNEIQLLFNTIANIAESRFNFFMFMWM